MTDQRLIRLKNLKRYVSAPGRRWGPTQIANVAGYGKPSYWNDLLRAATNETEAGKAFGEKAARRVETALGLPTYWLDQEGAPVPAAPAGIVEEVRQCLSKVVGELAELPEEEAKAYGSNLIEACRRVSDRAEELRAGAQKSPADFFRDLQMEIENLPEQQRAAAWQRALKAVTPSEPLPAPAPEAKAPTSAPAAPPKRERRPH